MHHIDVGVDWNLLKPIEVIELLHPFLIKESLGVRD
jgi:hypothetical protein